MVIVMAGTTMTINGHSGARTPKIGPEWADFPSKPDLEIPEILGFPGFSRPGLLDKNGHFEPIFVHFRIIWPNWQNGHFGHFDPQMGPGGPILPYNRRRRRGAVEELE